MATEALRLISRCGSPLFVDDGLHPLAETFKWPSRWWYWRAAARLRAKTATDRSERGLSSRCRRILPLVANETVWFGCVGFGVGEACL
jgi:hypothetical protein